MKDHSTGTQVVAGQIFIDSEERESHTDDGESFRSQEEKESTLEELNTLEHSTLLNKDLENTEVQKPGILMYILDMYQQSLKGGG